MVRKSRSGFTLVELLVVVIILGILAAVVIPQFSSASVEAKEAALMTDLAALRNAVALYKVQHKDVYPGTISGTMVDAMMTVKSYNRKKSLEISQVRFDFKLNPFGHNPKMMVYLTRTW